MNKQQKLVNLYILNSDYFLTLIDMIILILMIQIPEAHFRSLQDTEYIMNIAGNESIESLFKDFYEVTGINSGIWDINYHNVVKHGEDSLCRYIHNADHRTVEECMKCDRTASRQCLAANKGILYRCPMGLLEYIVPVRDENNTVVGFATTGMICDGSEAEFSALMKKVVSYQLDRTEITELYNAVPHYSAEHIKSICTIFETCISHIYHENLLKLNDLGFFQNIEIYISSNIDQNISVKSICREFMVSRMELYDLFEKYSGTGVARYIKKTRLETAKNLLKTTNLNVSEVADRVGYHDYSYFTKVFKEEYGALPKTFKNN